MLFSTLISFLFLLFYLCFQFEALFRNTKGSLFIFESQKQKSFKVSLKRKQANINIVDEWKLIFYVDHHWFGWKLLKYRVEISCEVHYGELQGLKLMLAYINICQEIRKSWWNIDWIISVWFTCALIKIPLHNWELKWNKLSPFSR